MKNLGGIKIIMIAALALLILAGTCAAVSLSNSGGGTWKYQRDISIKENSGTMLTDYQVLIELKGADFPNEAKSDGADVRFMDSGGNELNYWIESWDYAGKSGKVWAKVPSLTASSTVVIRMFYGNPSAVGTKNIAMMSYNQIGDDFEDGTFDTTKWDACYSGGCPIESGGLLKLYGANIGARKTGAGGLNLALRFRADFSTTSTGLEEWIGFATDWGSGPFMLFDDNAAKGFRAWTHDGTNNCEISVAEPGNGFKVFEIQRTSSYITYVEDNAIVNHQTSCLKSDTINVIIGLNNNNANNKLEVDWIFLKKFVSPEPTITLAPPKSSSLTITKSATPYSLRQFQESTIKVLIENSGTSEVKAIEIMDSIHPSFDLTGGDFPNPKKFASIRAGESRELQYTIKSKESGAFTLDPATVTYADSEGNIQEVRSEPVSIKVVASSDGGSSTNSGQASKSASVSLHGEKTDVVMGEDILLRLSAVNLITKPKMHVQVIIIPPSGMSVTSSEFSKSAAGQFTANYQLEPGDGKDIEVRIRSNQVGDFNVNGRIIYYFGDDKEKAEDQTLNLPIKVRKEPGQTAPAASADVPAKAPGFEGVIGISGLLFVLVLIKRSSSLK